MPLDRFLVGFTDGNASLQRDLKPWLIADNAFETLKNVYPFRGRIRKRFGGVLTGYGSPNTLYAPFFSRSSISVGVTDGSGNLSGTVPGSVFKIGQQFTIGTSEILTVYQLGAVQPMLSTGGSTTHTFSTTNGAFNIVGAAAVSNVFFYPAEPIMGINIYQSGSINNQPTYFFDTQFVYSFNGLFWARNGTAIWHGNDTNFMWTANYRGNTDAIVVFFATNYKFTAPNPVTATDDPIWWTVDGSNWTSGTGNNAFYFLPSPGTPPVPIPRFTGPYVKTAKIIVQFKNRLLLLSTVENNNPNGDGTAGTNTVYTNRCRYSINGSPFAQNAWYEPSTKDSSATANNLSIAAGAGFIDAPTEEQIISVEFIKDRLIVFFERSTFELAYTGNQVLPFVWQRLNTELGSQSTFSSVPFDREILTIGGTGIHSCNGSNVTRIDNKIPSEVFNINNANSGIGRVGGIRDYYVEQVYWTFPSDDENPIEKYPNRVIVYNYQTGGWAINDDCITAFGYFQQDRAVLWNNQYQSWEDSTETWISGDNAVNFRQILAGNQQGFVFEVDSDSSRNAPVMVLTQIVNTAPNMTATIIDHTLQNNDFVLIENAQGITGVNGNIYQVQNVIDKDNVLIGLGALVGVYTGGGSVTRVSVIDMLTKQYNPYVDRGRNVFLAKIDFGVLRTAAGQITVDYYPSSTELSMIQQGQLTGSIMGTGVLEMSPYTLYPLEQFQDRLWHVMYFQVTGECIQLHIYMTAAQMTIPTVSLSDFELDGFVMHVSPTSDRLQ